MLNDRKDGFSPDRCILMRRKSSVLQQSATVSPSYRLFSSKNIIMELLAKNILSKDGYFEKYIREYVRKVRNNFELIAALYCSVRIVTFNSEDSKNFATEKGFFVVNMKSEGNLSINWKINIFKTRHFCLRKIILQNFFFFFFFFFSRINQFYIWAIFEQRDTECITNTTWIDYLLNFDHLNIVCM